MAYLFVGVNGTDLKGDNVQISSYFTPEGEGAEKLEDVLAKAKALAADLKLNIKQVVPSAAAVNGAGSNGGNTEIAKIGSFAIRMQQNIDRNTQAVTQTPAVVLYPLWNAKGDFGKFSLTTAFLNFDDDVASFEEWLKNLGVEDKLEDLPLYEGEGSPSRVFGMTKKWEIMLPKTGEIEVSHSPYTKPDGTEGKRTKLVRWM